MKAETGFPERTIGRLLNDLHRLGILIEGDIHTFYKTRIWTVRLPRIETEPDRIETEPNRHETVPDRTSTVPDRTLESTGTDLGGPHNHVLTFDMFAGKPEADVEDVIGWKNYLALVNACYALDPLRALNDAESVNERVVKKVEEKFRTMPLGTPEFDHYAVAEISLAESRCSAQDNT